MLFETFVIKMFLTSISGGRNFLALLLLAGAVGWILAPASYIADDSYFYMVVARNWVLLGSQTFSGVMITNGVHPLWQWILAGHAWLVGSVLGPGLLWHEASYIAPSLAALALGMWFWHLVSRELGLASVLVAGFPATFLLIFGVLGSEAHLQFCTAAAFSVLAVKGRLTSSPMSALASGAAAGLMILSRLDLVFLAAGFSVFFVRDRRLQIIPFSLYCLGGMLLVCPYIVSNLIWFGGAMPVSGWMKGSFPELHHQPSFFIGIQSVVWGYSVTFGVAPILLGVLTLATTRAVSTRTLLLTAFVIGSTLHFAYIASFTRSHTIWYWYFVLPVITGSLAAAMIAERYRLWSKTFAFLSMSILLAAIAVTLPKRLHRPVAPHQVATIGMANELRLTDEAVLVSDYPGYIAFKTRLKVMAADLLTANRSFYKEMRASGNALAFILDWHAAAGSPIHAVIYVSADWLEPDLRTGRLVYHDPRTYPAPSPIGCLVLGDPDVTWSDPAFFAWRVNRAEENGAEARKIERC